MDMRSLPEAFTVIMRERGWTQTDLAEKVGMSQSWVSQVISGRRDPGMAKAIILLDRIDLEVHITPKREEADPVERREFMAAAASVVFIPSSKADPYQDRNFLETLSASLARNRYAVGGTPLAAGALAHVGRTREAVGPSSAPALLSTASELMSQVALILYDAEKLTHAERVGAVALEFAVRASDLNSQARAYDNLSRISLYRGDTLRGIVYAQRGLAIPEISPYQEASLSMRLGRSLALTPGQESASREALDHALNVDGLSPFSQATLQGDVGIGLSLLNEYGQAETLLSEATDLIGQWSPLFQAQYLGRQAQTAIRAGDISFASHCVAQLSRVLPFITSGRVNKRVSQILKSSEKLASDREMRAARDFLRAIALPDERRI